MKKEPMIIKITTSNSAGYRFGSCPNCKYGLKHYENVNIQYCIKCGQLLKWEATSIFDKELVLKRYSCIIEQKSTHYINEIKIKAYNMRDAINHLYEYYPNHFYCLRCEESTEK